MKSLLVVFFLAVTTCVFAQSARRGFGGVVFPGGGSSASGGVTRSFGGVVYPGGSPSNLVIPRPATSVGTSANRNFRRTPAVRNSTTPAYVAAYPVYVGGYDNG